MKMMYQINLDETDLYGKTMSPKLPFDGFKWVKSTNFTKENR